MIRHARYWVAALTAVMVLVALAANRVGAVRTAHADTTATSAASGPHYAMGKPHEAQTDSFLKHNIYYNHGPVTLTPKVYINWWGSAWRTGFTAGGYTSAQAQTYVRDFLNNIGGSPWLGTVTQYCQRADVHSPDLGPPDEKCGPSAIYITNPTSLLKGEWIDDTPIPANAVMTDLDVAGAGARAAQHFGYDPNAIYFVFTPSGVDYSGFWASSHPVWCAWHWVAQPSPFAAIAYIPWLADAGQGCGNNWVNANNDAYGHGYFDGFSTAIGHELAEAETDPLSDAWFTFDPGAINGKEEIADNCAWILGPHGNVTLANGQFYAVQSLWSNETRSCVLQS